MEIYNLGWTWLEAGATRVQSLIAWLVVAAMIFIPLERVWKRRQQAIFRENFRTDIFLYFLGGLLPPIFGVLVSVACIALAQMLLPVNYFRWLLSVPFWALATCTLILGEITYYWVHRIMHEIPLFWRFHAIHHSAQEMDWLVNTRAHPIDLIVTRFISSIPLLFLGLKQSNSADHGALLILFVAFNVLWGFFVHCNCRFRFGFLEQLITTPAFHHWHHTNDNPDVMNKNYSAIFPWVDRIFGTYYLPKNAFPSSYGISEEIPGSIGQLLLHPFKQKQAPQDNA